MAIGEEAWREHAERVGRVTLPWNGATMQLLRIFIHLTGVGSPLAETLFFSHKSDRGQRGLIKTILLQSDLSETHRKLLLATLRTLDEIAVDRNLAAHTIFSLGMFDLKTGAWAPTVVPALTPPQDPRLNDDFRAQFEAAERSLSEVIGRLEDWLIHTPFPSRQWDGPPFVGAVPGT